MNGLKFFEAAIEEAILRVRTAYKGKVVSIKGSRALVQPTDKTSPVSAIIPPNIKQKSENITYMASEGVTETKTILIPDTLSVGDIVFVGISDRDISDNPTNRHHDINDGVILRVL